MRLAFELMLAANRFPGSGPRHGTPLACALSAGVPAEIDATRYASLVAMFEESFRLYAAPRGLRLHGHDADLCGARRGLARLRRLAAEPRPQTGRARRADDAEPAAISGGDCRHVARRLRGGERQPALQAARTGIPAQRRRLRGDRRAGEFRRRAAGGAAAHAGQARRRRQHGRHARLREGRGGQRRRAPRQENGAGL